MTGIYSLNTIAMGRTFSLLSKSKVRKVRCAGKCITFELQLELISLVKKKNNPWFLYEKPILKVYTPINPLNKMCGN